MQSSCSVNINLLIVTLLIEAIEAPKYSMSYTFRAPQTHLTEKKFKSRSLDLSLLTLTVTPVYMTKFPVFQNINILS